MIFTVCCSLEAISQNLSTVKDDSQKDELTRLENTLANIRTDLQEKTLQYNWKLTERYIDYCKKLSKITNFNKEPRLVDSTVEIVSRIYRP